MENVCVHVVDLKKRIHMSSLLLQLAQLEPRTDRSESGGIGLMRDYVHSI